LGSALNIVSVRVRWAGHVALVKEMRKLTSWIRVLQKLIVTQIV
jgi:hypothetical protein